jgi:hypothetical protein
MTGASYKNGRFTSSGSPRKSYYLPFLFCVIDSLKNSGAIDKVHFFAGLDKTFSNYARVLYKQVSESPLLPRGDLFGTLAFPLSKDTPPLQAADLLVYLIYRHNVARFRMEVSKSPILQKLLKHKRRDQTFLLFDHDKIKDFVRTWQARTGAITNNFQVGV